MITAPDFHKKQVAVVFFNEGEKLCFTNDNLAVRTAEQKIKFQCSCYRLFIIYAIGHCSITSALIEKAQKFGFFIALMTPGFRLYAVIGAAKEANTLLKQKQYQYNDLGLAVHIVKNKISCQQMMLKRIRYKNENVINAISKMSFYIQQLDECSALQEIIGYEGQAAKMYFKNYFNNINWKGRQPRVKHDIVNATLDIGYTLLFTFVDALLSAYGFDTYRGVLHRQFYMRKSLVCDIVEPFRTIVDQQVKKSLNLKQIQEKDFIIINGQYRLRWTVAPKYVEMLMNPILNQKDRIYEYIQSYYRSFMKGAPSHCFPIFDMGEGNDYNKL